MARDCADVLSSGLSADSAHAATASQRMHELCDPALNKAMFDISALTNELIKASDAASDRTTELTNETIMDTYVVILTVLFAIAGLAAYLAMTGVTKPIKAIAETLEKLSLGKMDTEMPGMKRRDEVGMIANAALRFRDQSQETLRIQSLAAAELTAVVQRLGGALKGLAGGDLTTKLEGPFSEIYVSLRDDFNAAIEKLNAAIGSVAATARVVQAGSQQILTASEDLAQRAERQAVTLQDSSSAMRDLERAVSYTAEASTTTKKIIGATQVEATDSIELVRGTEQAIERIKGSSERIRAIIGVIDEIALQTACSR